MDAFVEVPTVTATAKAEKPTIVAVIVVPNYVPDCIEQGVMFHVLSMGNSSISAVPGDDRHTLVEPRLLSRGFSYAWPHEAAGGR